MFSNLAPSTDWLPVIILEFDWSVFNFENSKKGGADSFRILIKKQEFNEEDHKNLVKTNRKPRWQGDHMLDDPQFYHEMQIICMSPAVAFQDFKFTRSVLLASGTLRRVFKALPLIG